MKNLTNIKINHIRTLMKENNISAYLITLSDFHSSEYPSDFFKGIEYITGFTGSNATFLIMNDTSYIWTDGRYFSQCEKEIYGSEIKLMKQQTKGFPSILNFFETNLTKDMTLAFDGRTVNYDTFKKYETISIKNSFAIKNNIDFLENIWKNRPSLPKEKSFFLSEEFTGNSRINKLNNLREIMKNKNVNSHILSSLEDIAWIFNLRGEDIQYNPYVLTYAFISLEEAYLFLDLSKVSLEMEKELNIDKIYLKDYFFFYDFLKSIDIKNNLLVDFNKINSLIFETIPKEVKKINEKNPSSLIKAIRNPTEIKNIKNAHIKEGVVFTKLMFWIKTSISNNITLKELDIVKKIDELRNATDGYFDNNFYTISAFGANSSMMHYHSTEERNAILKNGNFLLVDSGAHYFQGSTDTTRTFVIGEVNNNLKKHYTYVLKSLISLSNFKFIKGTTYGQLDIIARSVIWELELDYRCATGHGVGYFAGVHEGPNILRGSSTDVMQCNMITTVEPGIYIENSHGIRLENEILTKSLVNNEYGEFFNFETITLVPFDIQGIDISLLTSKEKDWINNYNSKILKEISIYLTSEELIWLKDYTKNI